MLRKIVHIYAVLCLLLSFSAFGAENEYPLMPVDTSSPRATLNSFNVNCIAAYRLLNSGGRGKGFRGRIEANQIIRNIKQCMDLSELADFQRDNSAKEAAVSLKEVMDRIEIPRERHIPNREDMVTEDGSLKEKWNIPNTEIDLVLILDGDDKGTYQFSSETVERSSEFLSRVVHLPYKDDATEGFGKLYLTSPGNKVLTIIVDLLPSFMREKKHGQAVWQWVGLVLVLVGTFALMAFIYSIGRKIARGGAESGLVKYVLSLMFPVFAAFVPIITIRFITYHLVISGRLLYVMRFNLSLLTLFCGMGVVLGLGRRVGEIIVSSPSIKTDSVDAQLIRILSRLIGLIFAIVLLLQGGTHLGIPLSSLLAGAGVAGAALALSAQDVLKNIFGSIMLVTDKPFIVGERIKIKNYDGVVEEVGLRSTKIRLLNGHQAVIPNEFMAHSDIENIGRRPFIRRVSDIPLSMGISASKASKAVEIIKELLKDHEGFNPELPPRVWLNDFNRDHLALRMIYWYHPPHYWEYTAHADKLNRQILDAFKANGIKIAVPAFTASVDTVTQDAVLGTG